MGKKIIYLDDAIDAIRALWDSAPTAQHVSAMFDCEDALQALPSAQPEIIRCKDCRWHNGEINQCNVQICASMFGEDFCSRAERRKDV